MTGLLAAVNMPSWDATQFQEVRNARTGMQPAQLLNMLWFTALVVLG